jgi:hypothetical protein
MYLLAASRHPLEASQHPQAGSPADHTLHPLAATPSDLTESDRSRVLVKPTTPDSGGVNLMTTMMVRARAGSFLRVLLLLLLFLLAMLYTLLLDGLLVPREVLSLLVPTLLALSLLDTKCMLRLVVQWKL